MPFLISKLRNAKVKIIIVICLIMYVATYIVIEKYVRPKNNVKTKPIVKLDYVVVHLDLKGAPPKLSYLVSILPMLKEHGVTGLLIEYEDMFPYEGKVKELAAVNCYKKKELQAFLTKAVASGFEIIPLVQTLGHLEFGLKLKKFAHLRENPEFPATICPSSSESQELLHEMLKQVIHFHQRVISPLKHIHVGCEEVFHLNECSICQKRNFTKAQTYSSHLRFVIDTVFNLSPDSTVLIWNDMHSDAKLLHSINLRFPNTDAVYWDNAPNFHQAAYTDVYRSNQMFNNLWIATAFKGADGPFQILPNLKARFYNHLFWLDFIADYNNMRNLYRIKGIILTGRSRYNHAAPMCELFPASIHSLILNLILIEKYRNGIVVQDMAHVDDFIEQNIWGSFSSSLYCRNNMSQILELFDARTCYYLESNLYITLQNISYKVPLINSILADNLHRYVFDSSTRVNLKDESEYVLVNGRPQMMLCTHMYEELSAIEGQMADLLSIYFEKKVIKGYIETTIRRLKRTIANLIQLWKRKDLLSEKIRGLHDSIQNRKRTQILVVSQ